MGRYPTEKNAYQRRSMKFELPGQLRGSECARVMTQAIALRRRLETWFDAFHPGEHKQLSVVLRVDGSLGTFGKPGIENIESNDGKVCCDLVIADANWGSLNDNQIAEILTRNVKNAIQSCMAAYNIKYCEDSFQKIIDKAG